jgi:hypothetical protein
MKKTIIIIVSILVGLTLLAGLILGGSMLLLNLTDCDSGERETSNFEAMTMENGYDQDGNPVHFTKWNDITYTAWATADEALASEQFAVATDKDNESVTRKVYEVKGHSREEWILEFDTGGYLLYKAESVMEIPAEFLGYNT